MIRLHCSVNVINHPIQIFAFIKFFFNTARLLSSNTSKTFCSYNSAKNAWKSLEDEGIECFLLPISSLLLKLAADMVDDTNRFCCSAMLP